MRAIVIIRAAMVLLEVLYLLLKDRHLLLFARLVNNLQALRLTYGSSWIVQVILIMKDHRVHEVYWVAHYIALDHLPVFISDAPSSLFGVLMMMMIEHLIHGLIVVFLSTAPFINNNGFFLSCRHHLLLGVVPSASTHVIVLSVGASANLPLSVRRHLLLIYLVT